MLNIILLLKNISDILYLIKYSLVYYIPESYLEKNFGGRVLTFLSKGLVDLFISDRLEPS